ncbi:MAG: hypothetical protein IT161_11310 [Bryobacterales bacterium]|nr:hypothetical protein [Bryobacterales bacterium]
MNDAQLTDELASRVMGWKVASGRFVKPSRSWIPKWRFAPLERLEDAFLLLDTARAAYTLSRSAAGVFTVSVRLSQGRGEASGEPKPRMITIALAKAAGIEVDR